MDKFKTSPEEAGKNLLKIKKRTEKVIARK